VFSLRLPTAQGAGLKKFLVSGLIRVTQKFWPVFGYSLHLKKRFWAIFGVVFGLYGKS
jgi:hypothetical protein